ncbi:hypothetical protein LG299_10630 [Microbacterium lacus]|uniref:hypothetical protein n=1 Tax=Microbacterium lacus TaxID=415217 RepID=UPI00384CD9E3
MNTRRTERTPWVDPRAAEDLRNDANQFTDVRAPEIPLPGAIADSSVNANRPLRIGKFALVELSPQNWVIESHGDADTVPCLVAQVVLTEDDYADITWVQPTPLPTRYSTPEDALADLALWQKRPSGGIKPVPIPHHAPFRH